MNYIYQEVQFIASHSDRNATSLSKQWQKRAQFIVALHRNNRETMVQHRMENQNS